MSKRRNYSRKRRSSRKSIDWLSLTASFYAMWVMIVCPLYLEDQYFNLRQSKGHAYVAGAVLSLVLLLIAVFREDNSLKTLTPRRDVTEWSIVAFGLFGLFSTCVSGHFYHSFLGNEGWWVGGFQQITFALFVILCSKKLDWTAMLKNTMLIIGYIVFGIGILHSMNIDFLFLHRFTAKPFAYISTMGNINWYVGFLCLTVPIFAVLFMNAEEKRNIVAYGIYMFMACFGITTCKAEGTYLGIGVCAFFAIPFIMSNSVRFRRFSLCIAMFGLSNFMMGILPAFEQCRETYSGIPKLLINPVVSILMICVGLILFIITYKFITEFNKRISRIGIIIFETILSLGVCYFVIDTIKNFGPEWGTRRGEIWANTIKVFKECPISQKLIGTGPETLFVYNEPYSTARGELVLANHSDFFQLLTTNGIVGLGAYLTMWGSIVLKFLKSKNIEGTSYMMFLAAMAYMGQALVNTMESMIFPMLSIVVALYLRYDNIEIMDNSVEN